MRHRAAIVLTSAAMLLPVLSAFGHVDAELGFPLEEREIVVTGHDDPDATLHIEAVSGVVHEVCPECVLEKRRSGADEGFRPVVTLLPSGARPPSDGLAPLVLHGPSSGPARAPPFV